MLAIQAQAPSSIPRTSVKPRSVVTYDYNPGAEEVYIARGSPETCLPTSLAYLVSFIPVKDSFSKGNTGNASVGGGIAEAVLEPLLPTWTHICTHTHMHTYACVHTHRVREMGWSGRDHQDSET